MSPSARPSRTAEASAAADLPVRKVDAGASSSGLLRPLGLSLLLAAACGGERGGGSRGARPREPRIEVVRLEGIDTALRELRGKGVLLNFWAIWCAPCVAELPELAKVAD